MRRFALRAGLALGALALAFVGLTWLALESGGVAIVETRAPDGAGDAIRDARAEVVPEASGEVRARLRAKYGWRDAWGGLFVDSRRSVAVRLHESE